MVPSGAPRAPASDYPASPRANSMAHAAQGIRALTLAGQMRAMRLSDLSGSGRELDSTVISSCAARPCAAGLMGLVAVTGPQLGAFLQGAGISIVQWWQEAGLCDGIATGAGIAAHEGLGCRSGCKTVQAPLGRGWIYRADCLWRIPHGRLFPSWNVVIQLISNKHGKPTFFVQADEAHRRPAHLVITGFSRKVGASCLSRIG